jgi:hypothetical protein
MEQFGAQLVFPCPAAAGQPFTAEIANLAGRRELRQFRQRPSQNLSLACGVMGRPECPADGMIDKGRARRGNFAHDVAYGANHQRWNSPGFDHMGDETDGLMAEGSVGDEQREIDTGFNQVFGDGRSQLSFDFFVLLNAAHEGEVPG